LARNNQLADQLAQPLNQIIRDPLQPVGDDSPLNTQAGSTPQGAQPDTADQPEPVTPIQPIRRSRDARLTRDERVEAYMDENPDAAPEELSAMIRREMMGKNPVDNLDHPDALQEDFEEDDDSFASSPTSGPGDSDDFVTPDN
jgi:hypothetical protein